MLADQKDETFCKIGSLWKPSKNRSMKVTVTFPECMGILFTLVGFRLGCIYVELKGFLGAVDRTKVYVAKGEPFIRFIEKKPDQDRIDIPNPSESVLRDKLESIKRFISILQPLKKVYKVPDASVHIFYDLTGPVIAFNAGGALFMNLRYYEGWRTLQFTCCFDVPSDLFL